MTHAPIGYIYSGSYISIFTEIAMKRIGAVVLIEVPGGE